MIWFLLQKGADINYPDANGLTPLLYAVKDNKWGNVDVLIRNGANIKIVNKFGMTIFDYVRGDFLEVELKIQYLKQHC